VAAGHTRRDLLRQAGGLTLVAMTGGGLLGACQPAPSGRTLDRIKREGIARVGWDGEPPYDFAKPDGSGLTGQSIEVARYIMTQLNLKLEGVLVEFSGLIPALQANRFDFIAAGMFVRPARCQQVLFGNPDTINSEGMITRRGNPRKIHSYAEAGKMPDVKVGVLAASAEVDYAELNGVPKAQIVQFPDNQSAIAGLKAGRADVFGTTLLLAEDLIKRANDPEIELIDPFNQPLDKDGKPLVGYGAAAFRKDDTDFAVAWNAELAKMHQNGKLKEINSQFMSPRFVPPPEVTSEQLCKGA
jgi:polar amino acid transport system substrate-binding protein